MTDKLEERIKALENENLALRDKVSALKHTVARLEQCDLRATLALYADPANYEDDKTWKPAMGHIERDYAWLPASRALDGAL